MGTIGSVSLPEADAARLDDAAARVTQVLRELERRFSAFQPDSELSRLNAQADRAPVRVSPELRALLGLAAEAAARSGGAFDVTVGPLMALWGFRQEPKPDRAPDGRQIRAALETVGWRHVVLSNDTVRFDRPGLRLDLGAAAKGYAVDRCCETLSAAGYSNALVNLGGNLRALGAAAPGRPWCLAVRHPMEPGRSIGTLELAGGQAVATSGDYERFVVIQGKRYAHIMDPRTGIPVRGMAGVTVVATTAAEADILSTTLFVLGLPAGARLLEDRPGCAALIVPDRQPLEIWAGAALAFQPNPAVRDRVRALDGSGRSRFPATGRK